MANRGRIVEFLDDDSKLKRFADDKGANLLRERKGPFGKPGFGHFAKLSDDGRGCMLTLSSAFTPGRDATRLVAGGSLAFMFSPADKRKTDRAAKVALKKGTVFEVGPYKFEIKKAGKPDWGNEKLAVELQTHRDPKAIARFRFFNADGKEIESRQTGSGYWGGMGRYTYTRTLALGEEAEAADIAIEHWTDLRKVELPFSVKAGVGL
jgi:hypothetical protein